MIPTAQATVRVGDTEDTAPARDAPPFLPAAASELGSFGRHRLLRLVSDGGMAFVYQAEELETGERRALKIPKPAHASLLTEEIRALESLAKHPHPHLCGLADHGVVGGMPFLAMPWIDGENLQFCLAKGQAWPADNAAHLIRTLALAMAHAHAHGVIHRDLKPANVIIDLRGEPIIVDFGLALSLHDPSARLTDKPGGTRDYLPPEVVAAILDSTPIPAPTPAWDIFALGVMLHQMLMGGFPWPSRFDRRDYLRARNEGLAAALLAGFTGGPSALRPVLAKALSLSARERYASAERMAQALAEALANPAPVARPKRVALDLASVSFVGSGAMAPSAPNAGSLWLDVGNGLRPGVIDHHHLLAYSGSTARLVAAYPELLDATSASVTCDNPLTLTLHEWPDFDAVASAYLAKEWLARGEFPPLADQLVEYVDWVDRGAAGATAANPCSVYTVFQVLANRTTPRDDPPVRWRNLVLAGVELLGRCLEHAVHTSEALADVDALAAAPGILTASEAALLRSDRARYEAMLADPRRGARVSWLNFPDLFGGFERLPMLCVRDVQNPDDPNRCLIFKDWARTDASRCPEFGGFPALLVFHSESSAQKRRAIISIHPDRRGTLRGLGTMLDEAESEKRRQRNAAAGLPAVDDRQADPRTGAAMPAREGYANADPWYDGRGHRFSIVDAPRGGTVLTEEEIEAVVARFGRVDGARTAPLERIAVDAPLR